MRIRHHDGLRDRNTFPPDCHVLPSRCPRPFARQKRIMATDKTGTSALWPEQVKPDCFSGIFTPDRQGSARNRMNGKDRKRPETLGNAGFEVFLKNSGFRMAQGKIREKTAKKNIAPIKTHDQTAVKYPPNDSQNPFTTFPTAGTRYDPAPNAGQYRHHHGKAPPTVRPTIRCD